MIKHVTELQCWERCRRKWHYRFQLEIDKPLTPSHLWFGIVLHKVLANYYTAVKNHAPFNMEEFFLNTVEEECDKNEWSCEYDEVIYTWRELGLAMCDNYQKYAQENDNFKVIAVERPIEICISEEFNFYFRGTLDLVVEGPSGNQYILDHKGYKNFFPVEELDCESQSIAYPYLWYKESGRRADFIFNMIRKKIPAEPQQLKNGGLSTAKSIDTTYDKYMESINNLNLQWEDYVDILAKLKTNKFVDRVLISRTHKELEKFVFNLLLEFMDLINPRIYPSRTKDCVRMCQFYDLCQAANQGGDVDSLIEALYVHRPVEFGTKIEEE